jgi:transcriptional regulator with XRE-family HTH domain
MAPNAEPQIAQTVGANIRAAREARGMTQKEVADAVGGKTTNRDVSRWESGAVEPGSQNRQLLARILFDGDVAALYAEPVKEAA